MRTLPVRLSPGQDLRAALAAAVAAQSCRAAFVLSGIGSLSEAHLRFAGEAAPRHIVADLEVLTLAGSIGAAGAHLHASLSNADGAVIGGHVALGCRVRTTAEVLLVLLDDWVFEREEDASTGWLELVIRPVSNR